MLTLEEAAKFMGIARSSLYKMTHEQTIPFYKPNGKMIFFEKSDLLAWVRKNRVASEAEISEEAERIIQRLANK
ncbi:MAG: helix-turn-helix domain-containing protein [Prevotella sp.]